MKEKSPKKLWLVVLIISVVVCILSAGFLVKYFFLSDLSTIDREKVSETLAQVTSTADSIAVAETQAETQRFLETTAPIAEDDYVDFDEIKKINSDVYAWIYIPNTDVDYPIAQSTTDDSFYLTHNVYKNYQFSGTIYTEKKNTRDFSDPVTVLYGHNMLNGTMFASLHKFNDKEFFENNTTMYVYTEDEILTYFIYSAYQYDDRHLLNSFDMKDDTDFRRYLDSTLVERPYYCNVREGVELNTNDRILTLSTCMDGGGNVRYLVQGVLVNAKTTK